MGQTTLCRPMRLVLSALLAAVVSSWATGCSAPMLYRYDMYVDQPVPAGVEPAREKAMVSLPAYRIEPPDLLQIEALKLVPRPPYRIEVFDVLQIQATGTLFDQPIAGYYLVEGQGTVDLGPAYGKLRVAGMTIDEAQAAIEARLSQILVRPQVSVQLARTSGVQPVTGVYLVAPDGTVNLRSYGVVRLAGMTVVEAREALQEHLSQFFDSPEVSVDVAGYNSKVYYIVTEGANLGDNIVRIPVTGNETVLDAITQVGGLSQLSSKQLWIARPAPGDFAMEQILPIDYEAITRGGSSATNYQLMPGDRLFISEDGIVSFNNFLAKLIAPAERLLGVASLGSSAARNFQTLGRQYNRQRGF